MIASYSQQSTLEQAIIETFGGNYPCEICEFIQAVDDEAPQTAAKKSNENKSFKLIFEQAAQIVTLPNPFQINHLCRPELVPPPLYYEAPTPPPRFV